MNTEATPRSVPFALIYVLGDTAYKILAHALYRGPEYQLNRSEVINTFHKFKGYSDKPIRTAFRELKGHNLITMERNYYKVNYAEIDKWCKRGVVESTMVNSTTVETTMVKDQPTRSNNMNNVSTNDKERIKKVLNIATMVNSTGVSGIPSSSPQGPQVALSSSSPLAGQDEVKQLGSNGNQGQDCSAPAPDMKEQHRALVAELQRKYAGLPKWQAEQRISLEIMSYYNGKAKKFNGWGSL